MAMKSGQQLLTFAHIYYTVVPMIVVSAVGIYEIVHQHWCFKTQSHQMGICCFAQSSMNSNMILTGSYDEFLRVWDIRSTLKPVSKYSISLGRGVWRIKPHPSIPGLVLAACMHNGFDVQVGDEIAIVAESYAKHKSLAYGAVWQRGERVEDKTRWESLVATCSFYDRLLRIWKPESLIAKSRN